MSRPNTNPLPTGADASRPAGSRPAGSRPAGSRPAGSRPAGNNRGNRGNRSNNGSAVARPAATETAVTAAAAVPAPLPAAAAAAEAAARSMQAVDIALASKGNYVKEAERVELTQLRDEYLRNYARMPNDYQKHPINSGIRQQLVDSVGVLLSSSQKADRDLRDLLGTIAGLDILIRAAVNQQVGPNPSQPQIVALNSLKQRYGVVLANIDQLPNVQGRYSNKHAGYITDLYTVLDARVQALQDYKAHVDEIDRLYKELMATVSLPPQPEVQVEFQLVKIRDLFTRHNAVLAWLDHFPNAIPFSNVYGKAIDALNDLVGRTLKYRQEKRDKYDATFTRAQAFESAYTAARDGPAADPSYGMPRPMTALERQTLVQALTAFQAAFNQMHPIDKTAYRGYLTNVNTRVLALLAADEEHIHHEVNELNLEREHAEKDNKLPAPIERVDAQPLRTVVTSADRPKPTFRGMELSSGMKLLGAAKPRPVRYITGSATVTGGADTEIDTIVEALSIQEGTEKLKTMGKLSGRLYVVVPSKETAENPEKLAKLRQAVAQNQHYGAPQSSKLNASGDSSLNGTGQLWQVSYPDPNSANKHFIPSLVDTINSAIY
jgi:hypothetical protein